MVVWLNTLFGFPFFRVFATFRHITNFIARKSRIFKRFYSHVIRDQIIKALSRTFEMLTYCGDRDMCSWKGQLYRTWSWKVWYEIGKNEVGKYNWSWKNAVVFGKFSIILERIIGVGELLLNLESSQNDRNFPTSDFLTQKISDSTFFRTALSNYTLFLIFDPGSHYHHFFRKSKMKLPNEGTV